jgi:hypothetical protein
MDVHEIEVLINNHNFIVDGPAHREELQHQAKIQSYLSTSDAGSMQPPVSIAAAPAFTSAAAVRADILAEEMNSPNNDDNAIR